MFILLLAGRKIHTYDNASSHGTSQLPTEHHAPDPVVEDQHPTRSPSANILRASLDSNDHSLGKEVLPAVTLWGTRVGGPAILIS